MKQCEVREATHVKADGVTERIVEKWGIDTEGHLAKPSLGGFGCVTESGRRVGMMEAEAYYQEDPPPVTVYLRGTMPPHLVQEFLRLVRDFDTEYDPGHEGKVHFDSIMESDWPVEKMAKVFQAMSPQPETMMLARPKYRIWRTPMMRWIVLHPQSNDLGWSGSQWMPHRDGIGLIAQISNFDTQEEADKYASEALKDN